jgi:Transposase zinc-binding domain
MAAIEACRTPALGGHVEHCADCGFVRCAYNSCRDRHCPKCQGLARAEWLEARQAELLPVPYFHVVFTVPAPVAEIAFHNKAVVYAILFRAATEALRSVAADSRYLGAEIGAITVLHTWGQTLTALPSPTAAWRRQNQGDDALRRRVHPPLPAAHRARRISSHPPHRLPCQLPSCRKAGALPRSTRRTAST